MVEVGELNWVGPSWLAPPPPPAPPAPPPPPAAPPAVGSDGGQNRDFSPDSAQLVQNLDDSDDDGGPAKVSPPKKSLLRIYITMA